MKKLIAKSIAASVAPAAVEEFEPFKWILGSVEVPKDKKKENK